MLSKTICVNLRNLWIKFFSFLCVSSVICVKNLIFSVFSVPLRENSFGCGSSALCKSVAKSLFLQFFESADNKEKDKEKDEENSLMKTVLKQSSDNLFSTVIAMNVITIKPLPWFLRIAQIIIPLSYQVNKFNIHLICQILFL